MFRKTLAVCVFLSLAFSRALGADTAPPRAKLSAAEIVNKSVAAQGGLQAWRAVQSIVMKGKMDAGGNNRPTLPVPGKRASRQMPPPRPADQVQLPFVMELKRPRKGVSSAHPPSRAGHCICQLAFLMGSIAIPCRAIHSLAFESSFASCATK